MNFEKKVVLMGLGLYEKGSGISAAKFFIGQCRELVITDLKPAKELRKQIEEINNETVKQCNNETKIIWHLGGHQKEDFETADWVIRNPDVPMNSPFLKIAQRRKIPIDNDITLFFRVNGVQDVIGVTGTRGKSTTATLIYEMIRRQYPSAKLGGNIGVSPLSWPTTLRGETERRRSNPMVLELSSFQLHNLPTVKISSHIAVWTNFYPDHLNKYKSLKEYQEDKMNILKYQKAGDVAVLNWDEPPFCHSDQSDRREWSGGIPCVSIFWFSLRQPVKNGAFIKDGWFVFNEKGKETKVAPVSATKLFGEHNQANILAAICAARAYGIGWQAIRSALKDFKGLPNRLEVLEIKKDNETMKQCNNVIFVNDCTATSPEATIAALKSFPAGKIILISGGNSKGSSLEEMVKVIAERVRVLILILGNANSEILKDIKDIRDIKKCSNVRNILISQVKNLRDAVKTAVRLAKPREVVLFSPGLTWLPKMNEFERGEEFRRIINGLDKSGS